MSSKQRTTLVDILIGTAVSLVLLIVPFAPAVGGYVAGGRRRRSASSAALVGFGVGCCGVLPIVFVVAAAFGPLAESIGLEVGPAFFGLVPVSSAPSVGFPIVAGALAAYYLLCGVLGGWLSTVMRVNDDRSAAQSLGL